MTLIRSDTWICPRCGAAGTFNRFDTLNVSLNPDARERLLAGKLASERCAMCQVVTELHYPMLYNDPGRGVMIHTLGIGKPPTREMFAEQLPRPAQLRIFERLRPYRFRLAANFSDLVERINILESGLDERVVERLKMIPGDEHFRALAEVHPVLLPALQQVALLSAGQAQEKPAEPKLVRASLPRFLALTETGDALRFDTGYVFALVRERQPMPLHVLWKREEHDRLAGLLGAHWPLPEPIAEKWLWFDPFESQRLGETAPVPDLSKISTLLPDPGRFYAQGGAGETPSSASPGTPPTDASGSQSPSRLGRGRGLRQIPAAWRWPGAFWRSRACSSW